jgi:hypothetical protein
VIIAMVSCLSSALAGLAMSAAEQAIALAVKANVIVVLILGISFLLHRMRHLGARL